MRLAAAHGTGLMGLSAAPNLLGLVDVLRVDQDGAFWFVAVQALRGGDFPFLLAAVKCLFELVGDIFVDSSEWNLVEAALWRPLLFVLASRLDEPEEAVVAVAVAGNFDDVFF